jgi:serine/threonine-protein kinase
MALEFVVGPTLSQAIRKQAFTRREFAAIAWKVAQGLAHVHERGVVHADITPGNILLSSDGSPKLIDFGIAHCPELDPLPLPPGVTAGTPVYMSPEQVQGTKNLDGRTDVYSLGAVLYEAVVGRAPFKGPSTMEILDRVARTDPARPRSLDPSLDPYLEGIILRAMAKRSDDRYPTAQALACDLDLWIRSMPDCFSILPSS